MKKIFQMKEQSQKEAGVKDRKELHIRKNDWIPRTAHQKQKAVNEVREKLRIELRRVRFLP